MAYLAGQAVIEIKAGAPNNARGEDNIGMVKKFTAGRETFPYVSAQAWRRWLRDSLPSSEPVSPVFRSGEGKKQQAYTKGRPDMFLDDDLFGYMIAVKATMGGTKKAETKRFMRDTVLSTGTLVSVVAHRPTQDFGTMSRGFEPGTNPVIHEHEMYTADLAGDFLVDLPRVGTFETAGKTMKNAIPSTVATELLDGTCESVTVRHVDCVRLPLIERRRRVSVLLRTLAEVKGGAKQSAHYGDRTPAIVLIAPVKGGTNPFTRVIRGRDSKTYFDADILREEIEAWQDELDGAVRIGWAPGFLGDQRDRSRRDLADFVSDGRVVLGHPRTVLNGLADEFVDGAHDSWFDDPAPKSATSL